MWTEPSRARSGTHGSVHHFLGRNDVGFHSSGAKWSAGTFVAPAVTHDRLLEGVSLPDGGRPLDQGARVRARCESVPLRDGDPQDAWRRIPIHVTVEFEGHRPLEYDFRLDDPVVPRILERVE